MVFLGLLTAFAAAVFGLFIYSMVQAGRQYRPDGTAIAIWVLCMVLVVAAVIFGWLWLCCGCGVPCGIAFVVIDGLAMVFFIVMLALYTWARIELALGIIGMILCLALLVIGILGLVMGGLG